MTPIRGCRRTIPALPRTLLCALALFCFVYSAKGQEDPALLLQQRVTAAYERNMKGVVAIARFRKGRVDVLDRLRFNQPQFGLPTPDGETGLPTEVFGGILLSQNEILTCYHGLDDPKLNEFWVWAVGDGLTLDAFPAEVRGGDPWTDLAVLRANDLKGTGLEWGNPERLRIGHFVLSILPPTSRFRDERPSLRWGLVSNLRQAEPVENGGPGSRMMPRESLQEYGSLMQLDIRMPRAVSGAPILDLEGKVVGLTTSLAARLGDERSAGYAIPLDRAMREVVESLRAGRQAEFGFLGIEPIDVEGSLQAMGYRGALVRHVVPGFPGDLAGLRVGEVVTAVDGRPIDGAASLFLELSRRPARSTVELSVTRVERSRPPIPRTVVATLGKKHMITRKPAFALDAPPQWRGMRVDWSTALAPDQLMNLVPTTDKPPPVAIVNVDPETPAWNAGLRPGMLLLAVDNQVLESPEHLFQAVASQDGPVALKVVGDAGRTQVLNVPPPEPAP